MKNNEKNQPTLKEIIENIKFSNDSYISGIRALNIYDFEFDTGDWHTIETWADTCYTLPKSHWLGKNSPNLDTSPYLGYKGIFLADSVLKRMGINYSVPVYAANHARAISDLVLFGIIECGDGSTLMDKWFFDDMMCTHKDKKRVYEMIEPALNLLGNSHRPLLEKWLKDMKNYEIEMNVLKRPLINEDEYNKSLVS
ncbi:MAG: hypothetical protein KGV51_02940 [Moraxellaceae bacterium]|nr:hypothetical protein [Moraxellaceae bacterium]